MMLDCQPQIAGSVLNSQGTFDILQMPQLVDLPIAWPGGGGCTLTFPIKPGDECWVVFGSRCIDSWWQKGPQTTGTTIAVPPDERMHSLSDGVAYVGVRSQPREFDVNSTAAQLRTDDGLSVIGVDPDTGDINITTSEAEANINGITVDPAGNMITPGNVTIGNGATGTFTTTTGAVVTVQDGVVIGIF